MHWFLTDRTTPTPTPPVDPGTISPSIRNPQPPPPQISADRVTPVSAAVTPEPYPHPRHFGFRHHPLPTRFSTQEIQRAQEMNLPRRVRWHRGTPPDASVATQNPDPHRHTPSEPPSRDVSQWPLCALHRWYATSDARHVVSMDITRSWGGGPPPNWPSATTKTSRRHAAILPPPPHVNQEMNHNRRCKRRTVTVVIDCLDCCNFEGGTTTLIHPRLDLRQVGWG
jgi:hypothetical protein